MADNNSREAVMSFLFQVGGKAGGTNAVAGIFGDLLPGRGNNLTQSLTDVVKSLSSVRTTSDAYAEAIASSTRALSQNTLTQSSAGSQGSASTIASVATSILGKSLGLIPSLVMSIARLFGGDDNKPAAPLQRYALPPQIQIDGANPSGNDPGISLVSYGQDGLPRRVVTSREISEPSASRQAGADAGSPSSPPQININIQAIDSRSFMDHSDEIARAVREAMLNMHSLNDVVSDL